MSQLDQINRPIEDGPLASDLYFLYLLLMIGTALVSMVGQYAVLSGSRNEWFEFLGPGMRDLVRHLGVVDYMIAGLVSIVMSHFAGKTNVQRTKMTFGACLLFGLTHFLIELGPMGAAASHSCNSVSGVTTFYCQHQVDGPLLAFAKSGGVWALVVVPYAFLARRIHGWMIEIEVMLAQH